MISKPSNFSFATITVMLGLTLVASGCNKEASIPEVKSDINVKVTGPTRVEVTPDQIKSIGLVLGTAQEIPFKETLSINGQVVAPTYSQAHIYSTAPGKALDVRVQVGERVYAGQVLVTMKSDAIAQLESDLLQNNLQNENNTKQAQVQLNLSKTMFQREETLYNEKVSPKMDYDTAHAQYLKDVANLKAQQSIQTSTIDTVQRRLTLYGGSPGLARQVVRTQKIDPYISIVSPRNGVVTQRSINIGEVVDPSKEILTIADLSKVWLSGNAYERDLEKLKNKQALDVTLDSLPGEHFSGLVNFISNVLDPNTRTLEVRGEVNNREGKLRPNMFARMTVDIGTRQTMAVPSSALQKSGDTTYAYVEVKPNTFEERVVTVGKDNGEFTEILNGLNPGEKIAIKGTMAIEGLCSKARE